MLNIHLKYMNGKVEAGTPALIRDSSLALLEYKLLEALPQFKPHNYVRIITEKVTDVKTGIVATAPDNVYIIPEIENCKNCRSKRRRDCAACIGQADIWKIKNIYESLYARKM